MKNDENKLMRISQSNSILVIDCNVFPVQHHYIVT